MLNSFVFQTPAFILFMFYLHYRRFAPFFLCCYLSISIVTINNDPSPYITTFIYPCRLQSLHYENTLLPYNLKQITIPKPSKPIQSWSTYLIKPPISYWHPTISHYLKNQVNILQTYHPLPRVKNSNNNLHPSIPAHCYNYSNNTNDFP